jgi:3-phosphoshikimate 1-carboxyvinyltransferase
MDVNIEESTVSGTARAPPSKSHTHLAILAAGYSNGARINNPLLSADTRATMTAVDAFDGDVTEDENDLDVVGFEGRPAVPADVIDCWNSGTTIRLMSGTAGLADGTTVLTGDRSLRSRPHGPLLDALDQLDCRAESTQGDRRAPLVITGPTDGGRVSLPGEVSSHFVAPLLMAAAVTPNGIELNVEGSITSISHVDITREILDDFGIESEETQFGYRVPGKQYYEPSEGEYSVPADFTSIACLLAAGVLAADDEVTIQSAYPSAQRESRIVEIIDEMGGAIEWDRDNGLLTVRRSDLEGISVDITDTPDLLPIVAVLGATADGTTWIEGGTAGQIKTTTRSAAMVDSLTQMGVQIDEQADSLVIDGGDSELKGATVDGQRDHRIITALSALALVADGETTIIDGEHAETGFPGFFDHVFALGADIHR